MSKTCHECENCIYTPMCDNTLCPISDENFAEMCGGFTQIQKPPKTVFDRITSSPEVLAPEFVGMMYDRVSGEDRYYSMLTGEFYNSYEEAIAATLKKLKEVCNG